MNSLTEYGQRLPVLSEWMRGANPSHAWGGPRYSAKHANYWVAQHRGVEDVLAMLPAAEPGRLDGKRRTFRSLRTVHELRNLASELSFAARLARRDVPFDFGSTSSPQPDLVLRNADLGIEVTSRQADPLWDLIWHLKSTFGFTTSELQVRITLEFSAMPFAIRTKVREALTAEIRRAALEDERTVYCVVRPALGGRPAITVKATVSPTRRFLGFPQVTFTDDRHRYRVLMADIEQAIVDAMREKRKVRQARSMPSALVIDVGRIKGARPSTAGLDRLLQLPEPRDEFVGLGIIHGPGWATESPLILARNPHVPPECLGDLRQLCWDLQLPRSTPLASPRHATHPVCHHPLDPQLRK
jgi:hypothetical protein